MTAIRKNILGKNLIKLRGKTGYSIQHMADYLSVSKADIMAYESGIKTPTIDKVEKIAELYGMEAFDLYEEKCDSPVVDFAFKAKQINGEDLVSIASFMKIVRNYIRMKHEYEAISTTS